LTPNPAALSRYGASFFAASETRRTLAGYVCVGVAGVALYMLLLAAFVRIGLRSFEAFTLSYVLAVSAQFLMNKYWNFKAFDRAIHQQAATYVVVTALNYAIMIGVEEASIHTLHVTPLWAYVISIPVNLPVGYLANRFLTFGPGIFAAFKR
jgi:putative flippase GtrA